MTRFRFIGVIVFSAAVGLFLTWPPALDSQEKAINASPVLPLPASSPFGVR